MPPDTILTILGSGTLLPDYQRHSAAHHVDTGSARVLLDCGTGTLHGLSEHSVRWADLTHIAVTHYHSDHVGDLSSLLFALKHGRRIPRREPMTLIGPPGFRAFLARLSAALGTHVVDPGFEMDVVELGPEDTYADPTTTLRIRSCPTPHTDESVAYRLDGVRGSIGYTGDTGPSEEVAAFLSRCDVLIAECALTDPPEMEGHLSPAGVAELARVAEPELLVVTHVYPPMEPDEAATRVAESGFEGRCVAGADGLRVRLGDAVTVDSSGTPV